MSVDTSTPDDTDIRHAMSTLTEEERAAMADELSEHEKAALAAVAAAADDVADDDDDPADPPAAAPAPAATAPAAAPAEAPAAAPAAPAPAEAPAAPAPAPTAAAEPAPAPAPRERAEAVYHAELPADFDQRVAKLAEDRKALGEKLEAGEITIQQYTAQNDALLEQRDELNALRVKAEISNETRVQSQQTRWQNAVSDLYVQARDSGGIDYEKDEAKRHDLDGFVRALAQNPANEDKSMSWFLNEAHRRVQALHGVVAAPAPAPAAAPVAAPAPAPAAAAPAPRTPPVASAPATLAHVPGSDGPGDTADEFADLDTLDGDKLEAKLMRMTSDQRARYLQGT